MDHQDWKPVVLRKTEKKSFTPHKAGHKKIRNLDSDDPDAPKTLSLSAGKQIQRARSSQHMTQKQLAQKINERLTTIVNYENGKAIPNRAVLNKINRALGIKITV